MLLQGDHLIAYKIHMFNDIKRSYSTSDKELLATIYCLRVWRHYLMGSQGTVYIDYIASSQFLTQKDLTLKQAQWKEYLGEYSLTFKYNPR